MACLRVADVDAVEQDGDLLLCSSPDANVGLRSNRSTLTDIDSCCIFEQIVNTLYRRRLNVLAAQYSDHSRRLPQGKRSTRPGDFHVVERHLIMRLVFFGKLCPDADAVGFGVG